MLCLQLPYLKKKLDYVSGRGITLNPVFFVPFFQKEFCQMCEYLSVLSSDAVYN